MCRKCVPAILCGLLLWLFVPTAAFGLSYDIRIATGMDDVEEYVDSGDMYVDSSDLEIAYEDEGNPPSSPQVIGLRYIVPIAKGTKITKAYLEWEVDEATGANPVNVILEGQLAPNAAAFVDANKNLTGRSPWTTAKVKWAIPNWAVAEVKSQTPDISSIIQEIVNQDGWQSGNALVLSVKDDPDNPSKGVRCAEAYEGESNNAVLLHIEVFCTTASSPNPANGAQYVSSPLFQWVKGDTALLHNVYMGTSPELGPESLVGPRQPFNMYYHVAGLTPGTTYYWRVDEVEADMVTTHTGDLWTFSTAPVSAYLPQPRNGDKWIATDVSLTWQPGQGAASHEVYFGTDKDAVANRDAGVFKGKQPATSYTPGALSENTLYYWAIDENTTAGTKNPGELWSFTTIRPGGGVKGEYFNGMTPAGLPALTRIDPAIDFSWGDPGGPGTPIGVDNFSARWTADLEIAVADAYTFIASSDDGVRVWLGDELIIDNWTDHGTRDDLSKPMALAPGIYPLRMEYYENTGGAVAQLSWRTPTVARQIIPAGPLQPPVRARALYPADGDANVPQDITLVWAAGEKALQHEVYFGDDKEAVANATPADAGIYKGEQALDKTSLDPGSLEWNKTYYWRVDEVNDAAADSPWKGSVWSFTTADFIVVDDFESYNDEADMGTRIYETWIDGQTNGTTSTVGNWDPPFAEQVIVHSGKQSMPMDYNNVNSPYYAEAEREFSSLQNWKVNDVTDLTLFVRGNAARMVEDPAGTYRISANSIDVWGTADNFRFVYKTLNGDGAISAKVISMEDTTTGWAKAGVMIRESLSADSSYAFMFPTPDGRRAFQNRPLTAASAVSAHSATGQVTLPFWVKVERKGNLLTAYYSTDGKTWTKQPDTENTGSDSSSNPQTIMMTGSVCIGLGVASNNSQGGTCFATFSDVVTTGSVSGQFRVADIGSISPGNDPATLYVVVEDSSGKVAVASNPDTSFVNVLEWTEWKIPLADLAGVNLSKVKKMYIGVGDRANPTADGGGRIYIDDIRVTKP